MRLPSDARDEHAGVSGVRRSLCLAVLSACLVGLIFFRLTEREQPAPRITPITAKAAKAGTNQYRFFSGVIGADTASYFTSDGAFNSATGIGVSISSPGEDQENITRSGFIQSAGILSTKLGGGTTRLSGTSMASPHAAGVGALIWQKAISLGQSVSPEDIRARIRTTATNPAAPLDSPTSGYSFDGIREGVLSAPGALAP